MSTAGSPPVIAVFNSNEDVVLMLREALQEAGLVVVTGHVPDIKTGREDVVALLQHYDPAVIIYDIAPPYAENWTFLRLIQDTEAAAGRAFVVTTTNQRALAEVAGEMAAVELLGKPYDLRILIEAVYRALARGRGTAE